MFGAICIRRQPLDKSGTRDAALDLYDCFDGYTNLQLLSNLYRSFKHRDSWCWIKNLP